MAPAVADTLLRYFDSTKTTGESYDLIITGDLGREGSAILCDLMRIEGKSIDDMHDDCGLMIYDESSDKHAGGSGCGCSAVVVAACIMERMRRGEWKNVLFVGSGALMNPVMLNQGESIPGIGHLVHIVTEERQMG